MGERNFNDVNGTILSLYNYKMAKLKHRPTKNFNFIFKEE